MKNLELERKIEVNKWIIKARWFYIISFLIIDLLVIILRYNKDFPVLLILLVLTALILWNVFLSLYVKRVNYQNINKLGIMQIASELFFFFILINIIVDLRNIIILFFFLPIFSAALIFGISGAIIASLISVFLINFSVIWEYFNYLINFSQYNFQEVKIRGMSLSFRDFANKSITSILSSSIFYIVLGIFAGNAAHLLINREKLLAEETRKLDRETKLRKRELDKLNKAAKLLAKRDKELIKINKQLDKKIRELENSERSLMRAFNDLQAERRKAEEEKSKTDAIISNFIDPIIVVDKEGRLSRFNPAAREIFGLRDDDIGVKISKKNNFSMENFRKIIRRDYKVIKEKSLDNNESLLEEVIIKIGNKEFTYKVITSKVINARNEFLGTMKIFYNITREKMIDKLKSEFISIAAHQLRTPLSAIKWVIKMVLDGDAGKLNEEQEKLLFKGYQSNERVIELINDMLNVSRIEEGRFGYSFSTSSFDEVLDIVVGSLENKIKENHQKLMINKPKKLPKIYMDKEKMILVLQNLLENAVKYTPEYGTIEVSVEVGKELMKVRVKDNGVGIPKKDQAKLFSKFFRADNVIRMQTEGSGLGLFIVKNIIEKHGGSIICHSEEGKGTEFIFTLPIKKQKD